MEDRDCSGSDEGVGFAQAETLDEVSQIVMLNLVLKFPKTWISDADVAGILKISLDIQGQSNSLGHNVFPPQVKLKAATDQMRGGGTGNRIRVSVEVSFGEMGMSIKEQPEENGHKMDCTPLISIIRGRQTRNRGRS
jgi:hypothetical protein